MSVISAHVLSIQSRVTSIPKYHRLKSNHFVLLRFCLQPVCSQNVLRQSLPRSQHLCRDRPAGIEHHGAEIAALSIKELGCSVFPERRRIFVQDSLPFFIAKIVNATIPYDCAVIAAAHILLLHLHESNRFVSAACSGNAASPIIPPSHISLKGNYYKLCPWWGDILHSKPGKCKPVWHSG